ncbi:hypothetical protein RZE82_07775 [Mollicutes bacterium LVI A0039]|nr:hypothetical protein RZE82_07775 [Mollicutes bacterium LVI A0039]
MIFLILPFAQNDLEENELLVRGLVIKLRKTKGVLLSELIAMVICSLVMLIALGGANIYKEATIDSIPEDNFSGVSIEANFVISHFELDIISNQSEFDINELKDVLFDYQNLITDDKLELFGKINYTYYKKVEEYDKYGNITPPIECTIDFRNTLIVEMNFENITNQNIVIIGSGDSMVGSVENDICFGDVFKEENE